MTESKNYRQLNEELENIIEKLQSSDLDVDQIIDEYQKGITAVNQLEDYLESARNKITKIAEKSSKAKK
jgi:exodeoxyribonuclease VII small subunit